MFAEHLKVFVQEMRRRRHPRQHAQCVKRGRGNAGTQTELTNWKWGTMFFCTAASAAVAGYCVYRKTQN